MARDAASRHRPVWIRIVTISVVAIIGVALAVVFVPQILFPPSADVALIRGDNVPFKIKPKDSGGARIPHQETTVMGMLGGVSSTDEDVEILTPPAAVPEMPPAPAVENADVAVAAEPALPETGQAGSSLKTADTQVTNTDQTQSDTGEGNNAPVDLTIQPDRASDTNTEQAADFDNGMAMPVQKPSTDADASSSDRKGSKPVDVDGDEPLYIVQLAAFRDSGKAMEQAGLLGKNHQKRLNGVALGTMKIDTGDNGIFWRVVSEPLARADADALCAGLKRAGQDCILRKFNLLSQ